MLSGYMTKSSQKTLERRASRVAFACWVVMVLKVEIMYHFVLDSCDAVHVDDDIVVVEEMEQVNNVIEFVV